MRILLLIIILSHLNLPTSYSCLCTASKCMTPPPPELPSYLLSFVDSLVMHPFWMYFSVFTAFCPIAFGLMEGVCILFSVFWTTFCDKFYDALPGMTRFLLAIMDIFFMYDFFIDQIYDPRPSNLHQAHRYDIRFMWPTSINTTLTGMLLN